MVLIYKTHIQHLTLYLIDESISLATITGTLAAKGYKNIWEAYYNLVQETLFEKLTQNREEILGLSCSPKLFIIIIFVLYNF